MQKRGRPKGHEMTVVGLPKKKSNSSCPKIVPFLKLHTSVKEKGIIIIDHKLILLACIIDL